MNESFQTIVGSIQQHTKDEENVHALNRTIGRACVQFPGQEQVWWLVNRPMCTDNAVRYGTDMTGARVFLGTTGIVDTYMENCKVISKNCEFGRKLQNNYHGSFSCYYGGSRLQFDIRNAAHYIQQDREVKNVRIGDAEGVLKYNTLVEAASLIKGQEERVAELDAQRRKQEELRQETDRKRKEYEAQQQLLKDEAERKRLQEEHERAEAKRQEELIAAQKREEQLAIEAEETDRRLRELSDKYSQSAEFIRKQAALKNNPDLSDEQNIIIDGHKFDGVTTIINGGPGTGKTTTLIQRLSALIQKGTLVDFKLNHPDQASYTDAQIDLISSNDGNWMFFSPTELLRQYLLYNMEFEGLVGAGGKTFVWEKYLTRVLRDNYHLLGDGNPFTNLRRINYNDSLIKGDLRVVRNLDEFFVASVKDRLLQVADLNTSKFTWKIAGEIISKTCREAANVKSITDLYRLLVKLEGLQKQSIQGRSIVDIHLQYGKEIDKYTSLCISQAQKDAALWAELKCIISAWGKDDDEEDEESEEQDTSGNWNLELQKRLKALMRKIALKQIVRQNISGDNANLYNVIKPLLDEEKLSLLGEMAYFNKYFYPVITNAENFLFSKLTKAYRDFRKKTYKQQASGWNHDILAKIIEKKKNNALHPDEQSLLLGFINNIILSIAKSNPLQFERMKHKYVEAYRLLCRPVIGIDEATDYVLVDYYAMASLRHYDVSSFTLTGDVMQCLRNNGITNWQALGQELIFPKVEVHNLSISYRQSAELLKLAKYLYQSTMAEEAPYKCYLQNIAGVPAPLWMESDDEYEKAEWIVERVLDIFHHYGFMPSIAIFVSSEDEARKLYDSIVEIGSLEENAIKVLNCSNGLSMSDTDAVRIFPLDQVKGMEFEAVFFHNIDALKDMANNYLYVGLSRATFYMGVTSNCLNSEDLIELKSHFTQGDWKNAAIDDEFPINEPSLEPNTEEKPIEK